MWDLLAKLLIGGSVLATAVAIGAVIKLAYDGIVGKEEIKEAVRMKCPKGIKAMVTSKDVPRRRLKVDIYGSNNQKLNELDIEAKGIADDIYEGQVIKI